MTVPDPIRASGSAFRVGQNCQKHRQSVESSHLARCCTACITTITGKHQEVWVKEAAHSKVTFTETRYRKLFPATCLTANSSWQSESRFHPSWA
jgi:hypothetical protein